MRVGELIDMLGQANRDDLVVISCDERMPAPTRAYVVPMGIAPVVALRAQSVPVLMGEGEAESQGLKPNAVLISTEALTIYHTMK